MAVYQALLLNTVVPQIQAAQAGDSYVMVVNSTTDALRITQTGAGNALVVEDSANPDATPFVVSAAGDVGIGTNAPATKLDVSGTARVNSVIAADGANGTVQFGSTSTYNITGGVDNGGFRFNLPSGVDYQFRISGSDVMRLTSSGNLGLGVTPSSRLEVQASAGEISRFSTAAGYRLHVYANASGSSGSGIQSQNSDLRLSALDASTNIRFFTGNSSTETERARITSGGDLLLNTVTRRGSARQTIYQNSLFITGDGLAIEDGSATTGGAFIGFFDESGTKIGSVSRNAAATVAYNTSSDYRLKDNPQPLTNSGAFIDALKPKTWDWKADGSKGVGFIAHEVQEVSPGTVLGAKDAVDADGKPVMQAMEYGSAEFIANIVAELQSLRARVAQLEAK
jgi:hypothetical protein